MWAQSPVEWGAILSGEVRSESPTRQYHAVPGDYERWLDIYSRSPTAEQILQSTESAQDFFCIESDLGRLIPKIEWAEAFFSLKLGFSVPDIPMQFLYFSKRIYDMYKMCNLLGPLYPKELAFYMGRPGYFGNNYTPLDALRTYVLEDFNVVTEERPIVKCGDWYEAYLPRENMVCALPSCIGTQISADDCARIRHTPGVGLTLNTTPLVILGDLKGVSESVFDLRRAI